MPRNSLNIRGKLGIGTGKFIGCYTAYYHILRKSKIHTYLTNGAPLDGKTLKSSNIQNKRMDNNFAQNHAYF